MFYVLKKDFCGFKKGDLISSVNGVVFYSETEKGVYATSFGIHADVIKSVPDAFQEVEVEHKVVPLLEKMGVSRDQFEGVLDFLNKVMEKYNQKSISIYLERFFEEEGIYRVKTDVPARVDFKNPVVTYQAINYEQ